MCLAIFTQFGSFKTHVHKCFDEMVVEDEEAAALRNKLLEAYNTVAMVDEDVQNFKEFAEMAAFQLTCKWNAIMTLPRNLVYQTVMDFEKFLKTVVVDGT